MNRVSIKTENITLGQLLKLVNLIGSGGEAKIYLASNTVFVNKKLEDRRGRKLYPGDVIKFGTTEYTIESNEN